VSPTDGLFAGSDSYAYLRLGDEWVDHARFALGPADPLEWYRRPLYPLFTRVVRQQRATASGDRGWDGWKRIERTQSGLDVYVAVRPPLPAGATLDVPFVRRGAWDAALSTGALRLIDYGVVAGLSDIYQMQESYGASVSQLVNGMHAASAMDPATRVVTIRQAAQWWSEIAFLQKLQIDLYRKYLPSIRAAAR